MPKLLRTFFIAVALFFSAGKLSAQNNDSLRNVSHQDRLSLLLYARVISDADGNKRADENVIVDYRLMKWLWLEAGFRQGERPHAGNSYYHYKLELQTRFFWQRVRFIARLSDNVIKFPTPVYRKTNQLVLAEARHNFSRHWQVNGGIGYLFSAQQFNVTDALPTTHGALINQPIYKVALRYTFQNKSMYELVYGTYDVFNPYAAQQPFTQIATERELSELCDLYGYLRYQFNHNLYTPFNYFIGIGVRFHLIKITSEFHVPKE